MRSILNLIMIFMVFALHTCNSKDKVSKKELNKNSATVNDTLYYKSNRNHIILSSTIEGRIKARLIYDTGVGSALYLDSAFTVKHNWFKSKGDQVQDTSKKMSLGDYSGERNLLRDREIHFSLGEINNNLSGIMVGNIYKVIKDKADGIVGNTFMSNYIVR